MNKVITLATIAIAAVTQYAPAQETATLELGDFSSTTQLFGGSAWECAPVNFYYSNSGGQFLYTAEQIASIADDNGEITQLEFRMYESGDCYDTVEATITLHARMVDASAFSKDADNDYLWLEYADTDAAATLAFTHEPSYMESDFDLTFTLGTPLKVEPGKALLITIECAQDAVVAGSKEEFLGYCFTAADYQTAFFASDSKVFSDQYALGYVDNNSVSKDVPVVKLTYNKVEVVKETVATPVFTPAAGTKLGPNDRITIACDTEGASIYYTFSTDGEPDMLYTGPIALMSDNAQIRAIAVKDGCNDSAIASSNYSFKVATEPKFEIADATELGANETVKLIVPDGFTAFYKIDVDGSYNYVPYDATAGIAITDATTISAWCRADGYYDSRIVTSGTFTHSDLQADNVGNYFSQDTSDDVFEGANWYNAPIVPTYCNSASQMLYLADELLPVAGRKIETVKFRFSNEMCFSQYAAQLRLYLTAVDAAAFDYNADNGKYSWFAVDLAAPAVTKDFDIDFLDSYGFTAELEFNLGEGGFVLPAGKSLVVTVVTDADSYLDEYPQFFKYNTDDHRTAVFCSDHIGYDEALEAGLYVKDGDNFHADMSDRNQPVIRLFSSEAPSAITSVAVDASEAPAEYYTLQGVRVAAPATGIYIVRRGDSATKVLVK